MGKDFLMNLPFHSENVEEEEYLFLFYNEFPLYPEHAEEEKYFFFYICKRIIALDSAGRSCLFSILKLSFHSKNSGEEEFFFLLYNEAHPPL